VFDLRLLNTEPTDPYNYGSFFFYEANNATKQFKAVVYLNLTSQDVTALYPHFLYEAIIKAASGNPSFKFNVSTSPYPISKKMKEREGAANGGFICFVLAIGFALIPACMSSFILVERLNDLKHMQLISGMNLLSYWISNYLFDLIKVYMVALSVLGILELFNCHYDHVYISFLLYPWAVVPFTYVSTFIFQQENFAQTLTVFLHFSSAGIGAIMAFILRTFYLTYDLGDAMTWYLKLIPTFSLTNPIMFKSSKDKLLELRKDLPADDFHIDNMSGDFICLFMHFAIWTLVLIILETGLFDKLNRAYCGNLVYRRRKTQVDEDVLEEENRVEQNLDQKVRMSKFKKVYTACFTKPFLAVERISFGLETGECFCLLGVNGAGKTTCFKSLTNDTNPTNGDVSINGYEVQSHFRKIRKVIGFCPQNNAIFDLLTVAEHLEYYAKLKGFTDP